MALHNALRHFGNHGKSSGEANPLLRTRRTARRLGPKNLNNLNSKQGITYETLLCQKQRRTYQTTWANPKQALMITEEARTRSFRLKQCFECMSAAVIGVD